MVKTTPQLGTKAFERKCELLERKQRELEGRIRSLEGFVHSEVGKRRLRQLEEAIKRLALRHIVYGPSGGRRSLDC